MYKTIFLASVITYSLFIAPATSLAAPPSPINRLDTITCNPPVTPASFLENQPSLNIRIGNSSFVLNQPTSSAIVYILGAMWLAAGILFIRTRNGHKSRTWWGIALLLGGVAAISAGTSYQAFGYEIKCAGRETCVWTSWWEVAYLTLQAASMDAMLIALAHACASGKLRKALIAYATANAAAHLAITTAGALIPVRFMISFELMVLFTVPSLIILFALCGTRYRGQKNTLDLSLLRAGVWLIITTAAYFIYMTMGITQKLWKQGIWFSDNDVLHIFMITWIVYVTFALKDSLKDTPETATSAR